MREAMKKYKIAVGICGNHVLYTNIIKAHSPEEAVKKYLDSEGEACTDEAVKRYVSCTAEYVSKPRTPKPEKKKKRHSLEFDVTVCLGGGDGGDVCVKVTASDEEYELLKQCCRDEMDIYDCEGLEKLCKRIENAAQDECDSCMGDYGDDEEIDYDRVSYMISIPDEISEIVEKEDDEADE